MPNPISGNAVANAATQLRIINLDQVLDSNISTSMNFAIDFPNQTFRMTGLQLTDWLTDNLTFNAVDVDFDNAVFVSEFPLVPTPPENVQDVIDFGLPILANADAGNIGKESTLAISDVDAETRSGFHRVGFSALNIPIALNGTLLHCSGINSTTANQMYFSYTTEDRAFFRRKDTAWGEWQEIFSSATRTSAQANAILDKADADNTQAGSASVPGAGGTLQITLANPYVDVNSYAVAISYNIAGASSDAGVYVTKDSGALFTITNDTSAAIALDWITNKLTQ